MKLVIGRTDNNIINLTINMYDIQLDVYVQNDANILTLANSQIITNINDIMSLKSLYDRILLFTNISIEFNGAIHAESVIAILLILHSLNNTEGCRVIDIDKFIYETCLDLSNRYILKDVADIDQVDYNKLVDCFIKELNANCEEE